MRIKNLTHLLGNHDLHTLEWMESGTTPDLWLAQGGKATVESYGDKVPDAHIDFFRRALPYFVRDNALFVHAGIDPGLDIRRQSLSTFLWDRHLARQAMDDYARGIERKLTRYDDVYLGHTPTPFGKPVRASGIWLMDTGAGWSGVLSMLDVSAHEFYLSDPVPSLYPGITGRIAFR